MPAVATVRVATYSSLPGSCASVALQAAFGTRQRQEFSNPEIRDTIFWHNRTFWWDAAWNDGWGGLRPDLLAGEAPAYWDLAVYGTLAPQRLDPRYSLLTDRTGYHSSNVSGDPGFRSAYVNAYQATSKGAAFGNFVVTTFRPNGVQGDYHLGATSAAANRGIYLLGALLATDIDGDLRSLFGPDIGADEYRGSSSPGQWLPPLFFLQPALQMGNTVLETLFTQTLFNRPFLARIGS